MAIFAWSDEMSVGVEIIDHHHKKLIELINMLADADGDREKLGAVLSDLLEYTKYHFATEEKMMQEKGYENFDRHKAIHDDLTEQVEEIEEVFQSGSRKTLDGDVLDFLKDWLVQHIMREDMQYKPCMTR